MRRATFAGVGPGGRWRTLLAVVALLTAAAEVATAAFYDVPPAAAAVTAVLFVVGWLLLQLPRATGPILIGLASALEVVFTPFYGRSGASTWLVHGAIAVLGILGIVAAYRTLRADRDSRRRPQQATRSLVVVTEPTYLGRRRAGARPEATPSNPHTQLTQNAPADLQERVFALASSLGGVEVGPSLVSVPGARAFHLPESGQSAREAFMVEREFAHIHPAGDGSLHMALPPDVVERVIENGWAERHPLAGRHGLPANIVMVYGPRDENELEVVADLVRASHSYASGADV